MSSFRETLLGVQRDDGVVLVVGLGLSGIESACALRRLGLRVRVVERATEEEYRRRSKFAPRLDGVIAAGVEVVFGIEGERVASHLDGVRLVIVSPGVAREGAICGALSMRKLPFVGELELGVELLGAHSVVVTGSNGKSTTSSLIAAMLAESGVTTRLCGNIGVPVVRDLERDHISGNRTDLATLVVEASSYQLEFCTVLKPKVGVFLNLSDNHLERHGTMERYFAAKAQLFAHQDPSDFGVINADDAFGARLLSSIRGAAVPFGRSPEKVRSAMRAGWGAIVECAPAKGLDRVIVVTPAGEERYEVGGSRLLGLHNRYDIAAALLAARLLGVPAESARGTIARFKPLEHRLEFVVGGGGDATGPVVINDSKATTVAAAYAAVRTVLDFLPDRTLTVMFGGLVKAGSWDPLMTLLRDARARVAPIICFGEDGELIASHCRAADLPVRVVSTLVGATEEVIREISPRGVVLLSPGCASFDEFTDFEHRGSVFKSLVHSRFLRGSDDVSASTA